MGSWDTLGQTAAAEMAGMGSDRSVLLLPLDLMGWGWGSGGVGNGVSSVFSVQNQQPPASGSCWQRWTFPQGEQLSRTMHLLFQL